MKFLSNDQVRDLNSRGNTRVDNLSCDVFLTNDPEITVQMIELFQ